MLLLLLVRAHRQPLSYVRIVVWMLLGFAIYIFYGIRHSRLNSAPGPFLYKPMEGNTEDDDDDGSSGLLTEVPPGQAFGHAVVEEQSEMSYGLIPHTSRSPSSSDA